MSSARLARVAYSLVAWFFAIAAVVQIYLAGLGIFVEPESFELHRNVGYAIGVLGLVLLVLSFAAKMPFRVIAASALLLGLVALQSVLVIFFKNQSNIAALHPVNGFIIVLLAVWLAWRTLSYIRAPLPPEPARDSPEPPAAPASRPTLDQQDEQEDRL